MDQISAPPSGHPAAFDGDWSSTVVLGDGSSATIRPIVPSDASHLQEFHARQSSESNYMRYFSAKPQLTDAEARRFSTVDFRDRVAFVVEERGEMIGWASYERWQGRPDAEVAFQVDDNHRGKGIATLLLEHLASVAKANDIDRFTAETLGENRSMVHVFSKAGWPLQRRFESGVIDIDFPLEDTVEFIDSVERREQRADSRAVARLLLPTSIAVIGASDEPGSIGNALWNNTTRGERIRAYPVNSGHDTVDGHKAYPSITDIPDDVGLAIIAVPIAELPATIEECITKRVRGAVLVSSPLDGQIDMSALIQHTRRNGLRIIGPTSMGIASPQPATALTATLIDVTLPPGNIAISMQSGSLGGSVLRLACDLQIGISWFVSLGDKLDVSSNDLLQFWEDDRRTAVICLYTESIGNPRKFARIARRVSSSRPIIVVRTGAALLGTGTDAMYRQGGVIEVPTVQAMLHTARVFADQPLLEGDRVAVISNARSPQVAVTATLEVGGLTVVDPPRQLDWRAGDDDYREAIGLALNDDDIDGLVIVHAPPTEVAVGEPAAAIERALTGASKPVTAVVLGAGDGPLTKGSKVASFAFPEQAAAALVRLRAYTRWRTDEHANDDDMPLQIDRQAAEVIIATQLDAVTSDRLVPPEVVGQLLHAYGIDMPITRLVMLADAVAAAEEIGYPVAIKAISRIPGRSIEAGVGLDLADADDVAQATATMHAALGDGAERVWVQQMVPPSHDLRVRVVADDRFGPLLSVGLGGFQADLIGDVSSRVAPVSASAARSMIADTRAAATVKNDENLEALIDLIARVGQLASDHPEIAELDLNPIMIHNGKAQVVDVHLTLTKPTTHPRPTRRLET